MKVLALLLVVYVASSRGHGSYQAKLTADEACSEHLFGNTEKYVNQRTYPAERADNVAIEFIEPQLNYDTIILKPESSASINNIFDIKYGLYKYEEAVGSDSIQGVNVLPVPSDERPTVKMTVFGVEHTLPLQTIIVGFPKDIEDGGETPNSPYYAELRLQFTSPGDLPNKFSLMTNFYQSEGEKQDSNAALREFVEAIKPGPEDGEIKLPVDAIPVQLTMIKEIMKSFTAASSSPIYYWRGSDKQADPEYQKPMYLGLAPCPYTSLNIENIIYFFVPRPREN